jgi:hypothetical protein
MTSPIQVSDSALEGIEAISFVGMFLFLNLNFRFTTEEEVDYAAAEVIENVKRLREMSPLYDMALEGTDFILMLFFISNYFYFLLMPRCGHQCHRMDDRQSPLRRVALLLRIGPRFLLL